ncbi:hypothetical protein GH733_008706, partial [Mirounga leonina]
MGYQAQGPVIPPQALFSITPLISQNRIIGSLTDPVFWDSMQQSLNLAQLPKTEDAWVFAKPNAIQALGVMSFVYGSLEDPTVANWSRIIHVSTLASVLISTLFATCGYLTFTGFTQACYLKLSEEPRTHSDKIMSCIMLPVGVMVMVAGLVMAIANPQDCTHGQEMFYCFADNLSLTNISVSHLQLTTQLSVLNS